MVSGSGRMRPQEDSLNSPIYMSVGTPGRLLQHIEEGNMVYGDIKYLVLDEADIMFDPGIGPDIRKFLGPLKNRISKPDGLGFQTILVIATMTKAVQKLIDEEFQGIAHLRTSTLHEKIAIARHDFIKVSGAENKLEVLQQVLEPNLAKGNKVMVFCCTLNSSRAVDHFINENQVATVNYHGEVPTEQRVESLNKFKSEEGDSSTLVCTDLDARGLDLNGGNVIMFDFPLNFINYLHRICGTARMGAKGKLTSLVAKDLLLATRIEEALQKNESLKVISKNYVQRDVARKKIIGEKGSNARTAKVSGVSNQKNKDRAYSVTTIKWDMGSMLENICAMLQLLCVHLHCGQHRMIQLTYGSYKTKIPENDLLKITLVGIDHFSRQVCIAAFKKGKLKTVAFLHDQNLGRRGFDVVLSPHLATRFMERYKVVVYLDARAAWERLKKALSAYPKALLNMEYGMAEKDGRCFIKRDEFKQINNSLVGRSSSGDPNPKGVDTEFLSLCMEFRASSEPPKKQEKVQAEKHYYYFTLDKRRRGLKVLSIGTVVKLKKVLLELEKEIKR